MTIPQKKRKVKGNKRSQRKKRQFYSTPKKRSKKKKIGKKRLVLNTNARIKELEKKLAAEKKKAAALRKRVKAQGKAPSRGKRKAEPGTLLSERSEAARRGWTKRRQREAAERAAVSTSILDKLSPVQRDEIMRLLEQGSKKHENLDATFVKKLPEYLIRSDRAEFLAERKENVIMFQLIVADQLTGDFDRVASELAEEYELDAHEVYSLWHGYELNE